MGRGAKRKAGEDEDAVARLRPDSTHEDVLNWLRDALLISADVVERVSLTAASLPLNAQRFDIAVSWRLVGPCKPPDSPAKSHAVVLEAAPGPTRCRRRCA